MKNFTYLALFSLSILISACSQSNKHTTDAIDPSISKIEVIDFHTTHRCMTCNAIEANTKYTLDTYFKEEVAEGKITFQVVNIDESENEWMAEKFEASGTALFLNVISKGKERFIDLTDFGFMKGNEQEVFSKELKTKIDTELQNL